MLHSSALLISRGVILAIGPAGRILKKHPGHPVVSLENAVLMPGLVNVHTHVELPPLLDVIRAKTFPEWVMNLIRIKKELAAGDYRIAAQQNIRTLVRTGTTTVGEICTHDISPALLKDSGLRAVIYRELISMAPASPGRGLKPAATPLPLKGGHRPSSLIRFGLSPHAPYTVSEAALRTIKEMTSRRNDPLSMHVAESKDELRLLQGKRSGFDELYRIAGWQRAWAPSAESPFLYLKLLGLLSPSFLAVHAVQATDRDIALLKSTRTPVAHCPRSNRAAHAGRMPLRRFLDAGVTVGLGTDSLASAPSLSMWDEMRAALSLHRRDGVTARDILTLATRGGAKALGMGDLLGTLEPGKKADIIAISLPRRRTGDLFSDLLRETKNCIMCMVNGSILHDADP